MIVPSSLTARPLAAWLAASAACLASGMAAAQTPSAPLSAGPTPGWTMPGSPDSTHVVLAAPLFGGGTGSEYALNSLDIQNPGPDEKPVLASGNGTSTTLSNAYLFSPSDVHGFIAAGFGSEGARGLSGGVSMALVPGKVMLSMSANADHGSTYWPSPGNPGKTGTYNSQGYSAALTFTPSDDFSAAIGISTGHVGFH
jgi:hypothetical protein